MLKVSNPKVCFILGLAGSGKTHLAREMAWDKHFDEDFATDRDQQDELLQRLRQGQSCTVSEGALMFEANRAGILTWLRLSVPNVQVTWICFENDLETANWNCRRRTNKGDPEGHVQINNRCSPVYTCPEGAEMRPIYRLP